MMTNRNYAERTVTFTHEDGCLVRTVTSAARDGRTYHQRCAPATFEKVVGALSETPTTGAGITLAIIAGREQVAFTQSNVAIEFLKERGLVEVRHRRCYPAIAEIHLDAMIEFHALAAERS
jgi:hypothetical protein